MKGYEIMNVNVRTHLRGLCLSLIGLAFVETIITVYIKALVHVSLSISKHTFVVIRMYKIFVFAYFCHGQVNNNFSPYMDLMFMDK